MNTNTTETEAAFPVRDPHFTLELEPALRCLARHPGHALRYLTRRYYLQEGALQAWLQEFNRGQKELLDARIEAVKRELGTISETQAPAPREVPKAVPVDPPPTRDRKAEGTAPSAPTSDIGRWIEQQRVKIVGRVNCFQVQVTPQLAEAWLKFNDGNRRPSKAKIRRFAAAMKAGRWAINGETIKFSISGRLLDGQSRLLAIREAQVPIVLEVRAGLPDIAQCSMDSGELRKGTHTLEMLGEANPQILAPALKLVWLHDKGWLGKRPFGVSAVMENNEVEALLEKHADLKKSVGWAVEHVRKLACLLKTSEAAFFHYACGRAHEDHRDPFFEALVDGIGLTRESPVWVLRERLIADRQSPRKMPKEERRAIFIKAWNAVVAAETLSSLRWTSKDEFPLIA